LAYVPGFEPRRSRHVAPFSYRNSTGSRGLFPASLKALSITFNLSQLGRPSGFAKPHSAPYGVVNGMNDRIVIDPKVCHGKPVLRGTRMPVSLIVGSLAGGMSFEEVQREYSVTLEDIRAALKFAGELVEQEQYHPLPG